MSTSIVKVVAAFVAGLVVALGSALIYVRVNDVRHAATVAQASPPITPAAKELPDAEAEQPQQVVTTPAEPQTDAVASPRSPRPAPRTHVQARHRDLPHLNLIKSSPAKPFAKPIELAQIRPPTPIPATPTPAAVESKSTPQPTPEPPVQEQSPAVPQPQNPQPEAPQPHVVTLPAGTALSVRLGETLSTDHNYTGDTFRATLLQPVIQEGFIIADRGSKVLGRIVNAQSAGHMANAAALTLALTEINTTDGQRVRVESTVFNAKGKGNVEEDAAKIAGGAALGAILGGLAGGGKGAAIGAGAGGAAGTGAVLLSHGRAAVVQSETPITFRLANPLTITEKLN
ncbi:MAG TPA: hypothetical protein VH302_08660 [Bryobacteraceae bacterium]|nr:hypothetical protein [Bryobacteraceae bacterium]